MSWFSVSRAWFLKPRALNISSLALNHIILQSTSTSVVRVVLHRPFEFIVEIRVKHVIYFWIPAWVRTRVSFSRVYDVKIGRLENRVFEVFHRLWLLRDIIPGRLVVDAKMLIGWIFLMICKIRWLYLTLRLLDFIVLIFLSSYSNFRYIRIVSKSLCSVHKQFLSLSVLDLPLPSVRRFKQPRLACEPCRRAIEHRLRKGRRSLRGCDWAITKGDADRAGGKGVAIL